MLTGIYGGPGKFATGYVKLNASEWVYFKGKMSGMAPTFGQRIQATGVLRFNPGTQSPPQDTKIDSLPAHYFFDAAEILAASDAGAATLVPASQPTVTSTPVDGAWLQQILQSSNRDYIFCAASYLSRKGGPAVPTPLPTTLSEWQANGKKLIEWLGKQDSKTITALADGYPAFVQKWEPFFPPEPASQQAAARPVTQAASSPTTTSQPAAFTVTKDAITFDPKTCTEGHGTLGLPLGSVSVKVLGQKDGKCVFDYTVEIEGGYCCFL